MKVAIKRFNSCVMRRQKLQQYEEVLAEAGHEVVSDHKDSDAVIIWTCAFRNDFKDACLDAVKQVRDEATGKVYAGGCMPDIDPDKLAEIPGVELMVWRDDREFFADKFCPEEVLDEYWHAHGENRLCEDTAKFREENPTKDATFHDQFVKMVICEGCGYSCAYCSERLAFPPFRSVPPEELEAKCRELVEANPGAGVMLMADSLGQYGMDIETTFPALVRRLMAIKPDLKFAFNNLNPASVIEYYDDFEEFIAQGRIAHLNLPIQSASDSVLKNMNRAYTSEELRKVFELLRKYDMTAFDTHVIVGFPGEKDEDVQKTIDFLLEYKPQYVLASIYMESPAAPSVGLADKVEHEDSVQRIKTIVGVLNDAGVICNSDGSELIKSRFKTLFKVD